MRDRNVLGIKKVLPRMSWSPRNLYNLYRRSLTELREQTVFTTSVLTLFQQRWKAKQLTRAYHGDFINEKIFKRWYLPSTLPDVRPRTRRVVNDDTEYLMKWLMRPKPQVDKVEKQRKEDELLAQAPVASLMFEEVERRIDVFIFRCCFAHSVYEARRMVIHGNVLLNGKKHTNANTRIAPGDMVSVDPEAISFLRKPKDAENGSEKTEEAGKSQEESQEDAGFVTRPARDELSLTDNELTPFHLPPYAAPFIFIPAYIEVNFLTCSAIFVRRPTARYNYSEIPSPYEADGEIMRLTWEWYNKVRPRMRSKSQLARMPENRKETRVIPGVDSRSSPLPTGTSLAAQIARNSAY